MAVLYCDDKFLTSMYIQAGQKHHDISKVGEETLNLLVFNEKNIPQCLKIFQNDPQKDLLFTRSVYMSPPPYETPLRVRIKIDKSNQFSRMV